MQNIASSIRKKGKRPQPIITFSILKTATNNSIIKFQNFIMFFILVLVIYMLDQVSKVLVRTNFSVGESIPVLKNIFHLTFVHNTGAAFGMFQDRPGVFLFIAAISALAIIVLLILKRKTLNRVEKICLCFILAGTLGNLTDRIRFGYVIDFIDLRIWPVFNIADSFISIGAIVLGLYLIYLTYKNKG